MHMVRAFVVVSCDFALVSSTDMIQDYFICSAAITWFSQNSWNNSEEYKRAHHVDTLWTDDMRTLVPEAGIPGMDK